MTLCFFFITDSPRSRGEIFNIPFDLGCLFLLIKPIVFFVCVAGAIIVSKGPYFPGQAVSRQLLISVKFSVSIK